jgi:nucleoid-associated protein YgaU
MALFDPKSRYADPEVVPYEAVDVRGRRVQALPVPEPPLEIPVGKHAKKEGQTLDQMANAYLADPHGYWRIAEVNDVLHPDALNDASLVIIPSPTRR